MGVNHGKADGKIVNYAIGARAVGHCRLLLCVLLLGEEGALRLELRSPGLFRRLRLGREFALRGLDLGLDLHLIRLCQRHLPVNLGLDRPNLLLELGFERPNPLLGREPLRPGILLELQAPLLQLPFKLRLARESLLLRQLESLCEWRVHCLLMSFCVSVLQIFQIETYLYTRFRQNAQDLLPHKTEQLMHVSLAQQPDLTRTAFCRHRTHSVSPGEEGIASIRAASASSALNLVHLAPSFLRSLVSALSSMRCLRIFSFSLATTLCSASSRLALRRDALESSLKALSTLPRCASQSTAAMEDEGGGWRRAYREIVADRPELEGIFVLEYDASQRDDECTLTSRTFPKKNVWTDNSGRAWVFRNAPGIFDCKLPRNDPDVYFANLNTQITLRAPRGGLTLVCKVETLYAYSWYKGREHKSRVCARSRLSLLAYELE